jgi:hypothetical protein
VKTRSSWWLQLPAVVASLIAVVMPWVALPWPERVPTHFGLDWQADNWGSPSTMAMMMWVIPLLLAPGSWIVCAMWTRAERGRKRFNWVWMLANATLGMVSGISVWYWSQLGALASGQHISAWPWVGFGVGVMLGVTALFEYLRQPGVAPEERKVITPEEAATHDELVSRMQAGQRWMYCASQHWGGWRWLVYAGFLFFAGLGALLLVQGQEAGWIVLAIDCLLILLAAVANRLQVLVNGEWVILRAGWLGITLLRVRLADIARVEREEFSPLKDYGGWGIRYAGGTWAYFLRGHQGVRVETRGGKRYLIGSDDAERLAGILRAGARL